MTRERGSSLAEVMVAVLIVGLMTGPIMSVLMTGTMAAGRTGRRVAAAASVKRLAENLKSFVTADRSFVNGPGTGPDGWSLPGDASGLGALDEGHHRLLPSVWTPELEPFSGQISYDVFVDSTPAGPVPTVSFSVSWNEP